MHRDLRGKCVVVTGASRGIGKAIALRLATQGAHVVLAARSEDALDAVAEEVRAAGGVATCVPCDVRSSEARANLVDRAEQVGPIDVLVNNAGVEIPVSVLDHSSEEIDRTLEVNLAAPIHLTRLVVPKLVERGTGVVVGVSSMSGKSPTPYNAIYTATKHGLNGFFASLRIELWGTGVHCGVVCPSFVEGSGMWADLKLAAPAMLQEVSMAQVTGGVERVIDGAPEVLVSSPLARPLLALGQLFPRIDGFVLSRLGILATLKKRAVVVDQRRRS